MKTIFKVVNKNTITAPFRSFWCLIVPFEHTFHFEHICPYVFNVDFELANPAKIRSALKIFLLVRTNARGHTLVHAGFVSKSLSENSGKH